ncbi:hypothetical protein OROGR_007584 [Orobanche gracilis]
MDYSHANLCCVLKVDTRCAACKGHMIEVLSSIEGVYDVTIDAERKTVQIVGQVDPNYCVKALSRCGVHAELIWANMNNNNNNNNNRMMTSSYSYCCYGGEPIANRSFPPEGMWHQAYNINNGYMSSSSSNSVVPYVAADQYCDRNIDYNYYPHVDHTTNFCSIM